MLKIYIAALYGVIFIGAYWAGGRIANEKCRAEFATQNLESFNKIQSQIQQTKDKINAQTFNTAVDNIRRLLREQYTIHE